MSNDYLTCISVVDAQGAPIVVYSVAPGLENVLKVNMLSHISLDWFQSDLYEGMGTRGLKDIKYLFYIEGCKFYGQVVQQTGWKYILGFSKDAREEQVNACFERVRKLSVKCKCNPFVKNQEDLVVELEKAFKKEFT